MSTQSIHQIPSNTRQTVIEPGPDARPTLTHPRLTHVLAMNRRTTVVNKVNPYLQQRRRSQLGNPDSSMGKCQPWRSEILGLDLKVSVSIDPVTKKKRQRTCHPFAHVKYQIFCPACDIYFLSYDDYQNHVIIQDRIWLCV